MKNPTLAYAIGDNLYLNVTDRCTLRCAFCPKHAARPRVRGYDLSLESRPQVSDIIAAIGDPARYREVAEASRAEQREIEAADTEPFELFRQRYVSEDLLRMVSEQSELLARACGAAAR